MRILLSALFFVLFTALPARADGSLLNIQEVASRGGITAWLVEDHSVPVISLSFSFKGLGAAQEPPEKQGLSRLASNTMDEGAGDLDAQAFQKELRDLSINLSFNSGRDHFGGEVKTLSKNKARAFELIELALTQPRFDDEAIERMRNGNQSRIRSSLSDPDWIAARLLNDRAFEGHAYAQNSGGTITSLAAITRDDLTAFTKTLSRDRLKVAAAGDITPEELARVLDEIFAELPKTSDVPEVADLTLQNQGGVFVYEKDIPQTVVEIMQPGVDRLSPDYHSAQVMNFILGSSGFGSRLTEEIREKRGLTYGIYSSFFDLDHLDGLSVSTSTANDNVGEMLALIRAEFSRMAEDPISAEELADAQSYLVGALPLSLTSTDKISGLLLSLQLSDLPIDYLDQRQSGIEAASAADVQRVAAALLDADKFVTILVGQPEGLPDDVQRIDTLPNVE